MTSARVITMEYVPSVKISDVDAIEEMGLDRAKLAERSAISYLEQVLRPPQPLPQALSPES